MRSKSAGDTRAILPVNIFCLLERKHLIDDALAMIEDVPISIAVHNNSTSSHNMVTMENNCIYNTKNDLVVNT